MVNLGSIDEPVDFDWDGAAQLSAEFHRTAAVLEGQVPGRNSIARGALEEWRGRFAEEFENNRMKICTSDAQALAGALRAAATTLDDLASDARAEEERRAAARAWKAEHDRWQAHQERENVLERAGESVAGVFGIHFDREPEPFTQEPIEPKTAYIDPPPVTQRTP